MISGYIQQCPGTEITKCNLMLRWAHSWVLARLHLDSLVLSFHWLYMENLSQLSVLNIKCIIGEHGPFSVSFHPHRASLNLKSKWLTWSNSCSDSSSPRASIYKLHLESLVLSFHWLYLDNLSVLNIKRQDGEHGPFLVSVCPQRESLNLKSKWLTWSISYFYSSSQK